MAECCAYKAALNTPDTTCPQPSPVGSDCASQGKCPQGAVAVAACAQHHWQVGCWAGDCQPPPCSCCCIGAQLCASPLALPQLSMQIPAGPDNYWNCCVTNNQDAGKACPPGQCGVLTGASLPQQLYCRNWPGFPPALGAVLVAGPVLRSASHATLHGCCWRPGVLPPAAFSLQPLSLHQQFLQLVSWLRAPQARARHLQCSWRGRVLCIQGGPQQP